MLSVAPAITRVPYFCVGGKWGGAGAQVSHRLDAYLV